MIFRSLRIAQAMAFALCLFSSSVFAKKFDQVQNVSPLPSLYQQEDRSWCWAALTQIALEQNGINVKQCEIANRTYPVTGYDYCDGRKDGKATSDPYASSGGSVIKALRLYGVTWHSERPNAKGLLEKFVHDRIDGNRVFGIGVRMNNVGHVMMVVGYAVHKNRLYLNVYDPYFNHSDMLELNFVSSDEYLWTRAPSHYTLDGYEVVAILYP